MRRDTSRSRAALPAGLPRGVTIALDRTGRSDLRPEVLASALRQWLRTCQQSARELGNGSNDATVYLGPDARDELQRALNALPQRSARQLHNRLVAADRAFAAKTLPDPFADPQLPWWRRRLVELYHGYPQPDAQPRQTSMICCDHMRRRFRYVGP